MHKQSAQSLMQESRLECSRVAEGPYTPLVFETFNYIGGTKETMIGYPSTTADGEHGSIVWLGE